MVLHLLQQAQEAGRRCQARRQSIMRCKALGRLALVARRLALGRFRLRAAAAPAPTRVGSSLLGFQGRLRLLSGALELGLRLVRARLVVRLRLVESSLARVVWFLE